MSIKNIDQSSSIKSRAVAIVLPIIYLIVAFILLKFAGFLLSTNKVLIFGILFLLMFLGFYFFIYQNKRIAKYKSVQRVVLYTLFFGFSMTTIFLILKPVLEYHNFLRFRISGINLKGLYFAPIFYTAVSCFITYTIFTSIMEDKQKVNHLVKGLVFWFLTTIIAGYSSLLALFIYIGFGYQKECFPGGGDDKSDLVSNYCYKIGESVYNWWQPMPAIIIFVFAMVFIILYFAKFSKK